MVSVNLTSSTQGPPQDVAIGVLIHRYSSHCVGPEVPKSNVSTHRRQRERTTPRISSISLYAYIYIRIYIIYDICVCVCQILWNYQIDSNCNYSSLLLYHLHLSVCVFICQSRLAGPGLLRFDQPFQRPTVLRTVGLLMDSCSLRRSQAISGNSYSSDGMESVEHVLNMFDNIIRAFLHCKSMHERERERVRVQGVLHCFQTAFCTWLQLFWEYSCYLLLSLAISCYCWAFWDSDSASDHGWPFGPSVGLLRQSSAEARIVSNN